MQPGPRLRREHSRTAKPDIRLTPAEKQALAERAKHTGASVCELVRSAVENLLGTGVDYRSAELLRIMGEIVQQNLLVSVQEGRSIDQKLIEYYEREAARKAVMVLERRRHLLAATAAEAKGAVA